MPRIKIKDLPRDTKISKEEMKMVMGGDSQSLLLYKPYPREYLSLQPDRLIAGYNSAYFSLRKVGLD
jgi:hypothetical protein